MTSNKADWLTERVLERAQWYYTISYQRWALELSHDKNVTIAKDIAVFVVIELQSQTEDDFWSEVKHTIIRLQHKELYKP